MIILGTGTRPLREAYAALDQLLGVRIRGASSYEAVDGGLIRRRGGNLSTGREIGQVRLHDCLRIILKQPRRPEIGVEVVTLRLQLSREAAVEYDRRNRKGSAQCDSHQANLAASVLLIAELDPVACQSKIETRRAVGPNDDQPLTDRH